MIVNSFGQYLSRTVHDHEPCPICPISDPDITEYNGLRWSAGAAAGALPEPASSRAAHPVPPCPLRTILTSNDPQKTAKPASLSSWNWDITLFAGGRSRCGENFGAGLRVAAWRGLLPPGGGCR